jgi:hypothetical protein
MLISMFVVKDSGRSGSFGHRDLSEEGMTHVNITIFMRTNIISSVVNPVFFYTM